MVSTTAADLTGLSPIDAYTPVKVVRTVVFAAVVWFCVAMFIRFGGAAGQFSGEAGVQTYLATAIVTVPLNWLARIVAGMPAHKMPLVAALTLTTTTSLEGFVMKLFPQVYGGDPAVIGAGAVWLLYAVGLGLGASLITSAFAARRS